MSSYSFNTSSAGISSRSSERSLLSKSFIYMALFLLVTVAVSLGISLILRNMGLSTDGEVSLEVANVYTIMLISAAITQIVLTIVIMVSSLKQSKYGVIAMILYAICMGVLISSFSLFLDWYVTASAFGIAALSFAGMALFGYLSKNASKFGLVGFGLLFGVLMASLFSVFIFLFAPTAYLIWDIVTCILIVIAIMCITAYDVYNIKQISQAGENSSNLALYLAFNLYLDFILILIKILQLLAIFNSRR